MLDPDVYVPIPAESLKSGTALSFDVYTYNPQRKEHILYRSKDLAFEEKHAQRIREMAGRLYIRRDETVGYFEYVRQNVRSALDDEKAPPQERLKKYYESSKTLMQNVLDAPEKRDLKAESAVVMEGSLKAVLDVSKKFDDVLNMLSFEYEVYSHSLNVSILAMSFARWLKLDHETIRHIGTGALLHDIGKKQIPTAVLMKPGKLTSEEWEIMKKHSELGHQVLVTQGGFPPDVLQITRNHHEKYDGGGYPDTLSGEAIPLAVQISTHADIFDALTTRRCYKDAVNTFSALVIMRDEMKNTFRPDLLVEFIRMFQKK